MFLHSSNVSLVTRFESLENLTILLQDRAAYFISSIFLRRLLQPGVYQSAALRATILDHRKYLSDYEFQSLTISGLKKEILEMIESEVILQFFITGF